MNHYKRYRIRFSQVEDSLVSTYTHLSPTQKISASKLHGLIVSPCNYLAFMNSHFCFEPRKQ